MKILKLAIIAIIGFLSIESSAFAWWGNHKKSDKNNTNSAVNQNYDNRGNVTDNNTATYGTPPKSDTTYNGERNSKADPQTSRTSGTTGARSTGTGTTGSRSPSSVR